MKPHPYVSSQYANAFAPPHEPLYLPEAGIFVLKRPIPGTVYYDAMGCYPLSPLSETGDLEKDFSFLQEQGIVSLVWVTDPFFCPPLEDLKKSFDIAIPYKEHYLCKFSEKRTYSKYHAYKLRRSSRKVELRKIILADYLEAWCRLYQGLVEKHSITGIQAFPESYFSALCDFSPPAFGAFIENELVAAHICFEHQGYAYSHLVASSPQGYRAEAAYALYDYLLSWFAENQAKAFDLGGGAGVTEASKGLAFYKQGFSNATAPCYLCGKILDKPLYEPLSAGKNTGFFPAYRG